MWRLSVDAKTPPEDRDISGFVCSAYARPTAGSEQLTWTQCSKMARVAAALGCKVDDLFE